MGKEKGRITGKRKAERKAGVPRAEGRKASAQFPWILELCVCVCWGAGRSRRRCVSVQEKTDFKT